MPAAIYSAVLVAEIIVIARGSHADFFFINLVRRRAATRPRMLIYALLDWSACRTSDTLRAEPEPNRLASCRASSSRTSSYAPARAAHRGILPGMRPGCRLVTLATTPTSRGLHSRSTRAPVSTSTTSRFAWRLSCTLTVIRSATSTEETSDFTDSRLCAAWYNVYICATRTCREGCRVDFCRCRAKCIVVPTAAIGRTEDGSSWGMLMGLCPIRCELRGAMTARSGTRT